MLFIIGYTTHGICPPINPVQTKGWDYLKLSLNFSMNFSYDNPSKRGIRIALRAKANDPSMTGLRVVDSILPVGRGQRQLILGDRYTGKTPLSSLKQL